MAHQHTFMLMQMQHDSSIVLMALLCLQPYNMTNWKGGSDYKPTDFEGDFFCNFSMGQFGTKKWATRGHNPVFAFHWCNYSFGKLLGGKKILDHKRNRKILTGFFHLARILLQNSLCCCSCFLAYDKRSNLPVPCRSVALGTSLEISSAATAVSTFSLSRASWQQQLWVLVRWGGVTCSTP